MYHFDFLGNDKENFQEVFGRTSKGSCELLASVSPLKTKATDASKKLTKSASHKLSMGPPSTAPSPVSPEAP